MFAAPKHPYLTIVSPSHMHLNLYDFQVYYSTRTIYRYPKHTNNTKNIFEKGFLLLTKYIPILSLLVFFSVLQFIFIRNFHFRNETPKQNGNQFSDKHTHIRSLTHSLTMSSQHTTIHIRHALRKRKKTESHISMREGVIVVAEIMHGLKCPDQMF